MTPKNYQKVGIATVKDPFATFWALNANKSKAAIAIELKIGRDVKSSRPLPRGQNFGLGLGLGLGLKALASALALASNIWPRPGLGLQQKNQQPRRDRRTNLFALYFADYRTMRTSHYDRR